MTDNTEWTTIAFTALPPGWFNYYRRADGTYWTDPCPGILIQEGFDRHGDKVETRVAPATIDEGYILSAEDRRHPRGDQYHTTTTEREWALWDAEDRARQAAQ
jgi:hypothetical protein